MVRSCGTRAGLSTGQVFTKNCTPEHPRSLTESLLNTRKRNEKMNAMTKIEQLRESQKTTPIMGAIEIAGITAFPGVVEPDQITSGATESSRIIPARLGCHRTAHSRVN